MWCQNCRQEVPGIASGNASGRNCARCGGILARHFTSPLTSDYVGLRQTADHGVELDQKASVAAAIEADVDDWALDLEMQRMRRLVHAAAHDPLSHARPLAGPFSGAVPTVFNGALQFDSPHAHSSGSPHGDIARFAAHSSAKAADRRAGQRRMSAVTWSLLSLGLMAFVCGGVLLGWSLLADRADLWTFGVPIAWGGQLALLLGFLLRIDLLGDANRQTVTKLETVDQRLDDLKQTASLMSATRNGPSQAFFAHMASGANPQLMLADLKGQIDLLAVQMATAQR
jgi:hypothetical protein